MFKINNLNSEVKQNFKLKKLKNFKILWKYLKQDKLKLFLYLFLVVITYVPALLSAFFWGIAIEYLIAKEFMKFAIYLFCWSGLLMLFYSLLQYPRDRLYNRLEINFIKNVSIDMYKKIQNLPSVAFEEIGVGEFINRLYTDPDRVMELLSKLIKMICKSIVVIIILIIAIKTSLILFLEIIVFAFIMGFISYKFFPKIKKSQE